MKKNFFLFLCSMLLISFVSSAQNKNNKTGVSLFIEGDYWKQNNLNFVFDLSSLNAKTPSFSFGFGAGSFFQFNKFEVAIDGTVLTSRKKSSTERVNQASFLAGVSFKYHFPVNRSSIYPLLGVGFAGAKTEVTQRNGPTNISTALISRNTTTLYNRQGFAVVGFGTRLYAKNGRGFHTIEAGYRLGFAASPWNTDEELSYDMTNSVIDELRQVYLKLGIGFARFRGTKK